MNMPLKLHTEHAVSREEKRFPTHCFKIKPMKDLNKSLQSDLPFQGN